MSAGFPCPHCGAKTQVADTDSPQRRRKCEGEARHTFITVETFLRDTIQKHTSPKKPREPRKIGETDAARRKASSRVRGEPEDTPQLPKPAAKAAAPTARRKINEIMEARALAKEIEDVY